MTAPADFSNVLPTSSRPSVLTHRVSLVVFALLTAVGLLALPPTGFAQAVNPAAPSSAPLSVRSPALPVTGAATVTPKIPVSRPAWTELTPTQQQALKPLALNWDTISDAQKRKWLEISKNFASLPPEGQVTMHSRMNDWVKLSPQERAQARLNFAKTQELSKELTPEEKKAKWETYQALSAEEKQKLAAKASPKPTGAATAVKPVPPQKLAAIAPHPVASGVSPSGRITPVTPALQR